MAEPRATGAAVCVLAGAIAATLAVVVGPGPSLAGYVSEAGVAGNRYAWTYRLGLFTLGAALLLLASALRDHAVALHHAGSGGHPICRQRRDHPTRPDHPARRDQPARQPDKALRVAVLLLVAGALATVLSAGVPCSTGCPLPPFEAATVADLVHGAVSIVAAGATVLAMIAIVLSRAAANPLRRTARISLAAALPLAGALALAMLFIGRGPLAGVLERLLLLVIVSWGVATAVILATGPAAAGRQDPFARAPAHHGRPSG
ncbi:DUF998 domain-containing protein [Micromonospora sp. DT229]|uniref:DUF998 domain-containing protein n=1 Tax=Micromonospora sp. DT229 TaxID=3393430 RepID=UPI003CED6738